MIKSPTPDDWNSTCPVLPYHQMHILYGSGTTSLTTGFLPSFFIFFYLFRSEVAAMSAVNRGLCLLPAALLFPSATLLLCNSNSKPFLHQSGAVLLFYRCPVFLSVCMGRLSPPTSIPSSQLRPSHFIASLIFSSDSREERARSVSSIRTRKVPPVCLATSQLKRAERAPPMWNGPVGLGANLL